MRISDWSSDVCSSDLVHQAHHVAPVLPALAIGGGDENLEGGIARPGTHAGETGVDAHRAGLRRDDRVCDAEREIVMRMHPALRFGLEDPIVSFEAGPDAVHVEGSAAVGSIDSKIVRT